MLLCEGRRQYGISTVAAQTSFRGETGDGVAKCRLFSQAKVSLTKKISEQFRFAGNCQPTTPLSQHVSLREGSLRSANVFPVVTSLPPKRREATTGNTFALRRLKERGRWEVSQKSKLIQDIIRNVLVGLLCRNIIVHASK